MNYLHSTIDKLRDNLTSPTNISTFKLTGQITPEEFISAGDYLVYKFPSWSWSKPSNINKKVDYLPDKKQYLITRGVPCKKRLKDIEYDGNDDDDDHIIIINDEEIIPDIEDDVDEEEIINNNNNNSS